MKRFAAICTLVLAVGLLFGVAPARAATAPTVTLLNDLPTYLAVGESYTIDIQVTSDEPFISATAMHDSYYPGRGVFFNTSDRAHRVTSAVLHMTVTGKNSTAGLEAVTDWPETEDWPAGVAPLGIVVGVRYHGGEVYVYRYYFAVEVP
ncbi:MAG: hypothetical protein JXM73_14440 [Anaerolineae bacterium]|nr:hypothetical protein [Anaerolineae bacterium]